MPRFETAVTYFCASFELLGHLFAWAFLSIIFLTSQVKLLLYLFPFESELLLRSELPVVTLGKSLPGNCSKLGHLFAWAFLSIIFLTSQVKLLLYLFPFESELLLRSELPVVTLGKSLPGNCSKLGHYFVCLGFLVNNFSYIPSETTFVPFSI